ncbi:MAG TPA: hypothetical protein VG939_04580 [Caulobacteraceae bacterium]|nr:hypothetical protein [Caulobacteraceae bacterium]
MAAPDAAALAGRYDGGQMEIAAELELKSDGRFQYALSYGALDEEASGRWEVRGGQVLLTSDPVTAPRFVLLDAKPLAERRLRVALDLPQGGDPQYFSALVGLADGRRIERQLGPEGLDMALPAGARAVSVALRLDVYGLQGEPAALPAGAGADVRFRFDVNDLGKVAFDHQPLRIDDEGRLVLARHGRTIVFRAERGDRESGDTHSR